MQNTIKKRSENDKPTIKKRQKNGGRHIWHHKAKPYQMSTCCQKNVKTNDKKTVPGIRTRQQKLIKHGKRMAGHTQKNVKKTASCMFALGGGASA